MVGFIKGLFGSRSPQDEPQSSQSQQAEPAPMEQQKPNTYYLAPDDAKTLGDIDYMRTVKTVRRTFPKTAGATKGYEMVQQVSAMDKLDEKGGAKPTEASAQESTPQSQASNASAERRNTDSSMDMFRKMAKDMKR